MDDKILEFLKENLKIRVTCKAERTNYEAVESATVGVEIYVKNKDGKEEVITCDQDGF